MEDKEEIYETIARFRKTFPGVEKKRKNTYTGSFYASIDDVWKAVEPHLDQVGLYVEQWTSGGILYVVLHNAYGSSLKSDVQLPDSTDAFQKFGGALTYYRRYLVCLMLNVTEADHDDDGNVGEVKMADPPIDQRQLHTIIDLIEATGTDKARLLEYIDGTYGKDSIEALSYKQAAVIRRLLSDKHKRMESGDG